MLCVCVCHRCVCMLLLGYSPGVGRLGGGGGVAPEVGKYLVGAGKNNETTAENNSVGGLSLLLCCLSG